MKSLMGTTFDLTGSDMSAECIKVVQGSKTLGGRFDSGVHDNKAQRSTGQYLGSYQPRTSNREIRSARRGT